MNPCPLPPDKKAKVVKLMQLAQSDNDSEALSSLRAATRILYAHNLDWDRMLNAIDERKIIAWEDESGRTKFRPHSWAFDDDCETPKQVGSKPPPKVIPLR